VLQDVRSGFAPPLVGMVAVITAVLAGSAIGLLAAVSTDHALAPALISGGAVAAAALAVSMHYQRSAWASAASAPLSFDTDDTGSVWAISGAAGARASLHAAGA
jgi:ABC-type uncharacterized transport system permease subunit